jgi:hypothetical protein
MIRTRDFILFILTFCFLVLAIIFTITNNRTPAFLNVQFDDEVPTVGGVTDTEPQINEEDTRQSTIARLREKIKQSPIVSQASVQVPEPETVKEEGSQPDTPEAETDAVVVRLQMCTGASDGLLVASKWPRTGVSVELVEGVRVAVYRDAVGARQLLLFPSAQSNTAEICLDSEVIGVTTSGSLMFNTDAIAYQNTSVETLIGYARDGFPIYGRYEGTTDVCGGYMHPTGYRYSVSPDRPFILGCFASTPGTFDI